MNFLKSRITEDDVHINAESNALSLTFHNYVFSIPEFVYYCLFVLNLYSAFYLCSVFKKINFNSRISKLINLLKYTNERNPLQLDENCKRTNAEQIHLYINS